MTDHMLFAPENIAKAKEIIYPMAKDFLKVEPRNTLAIPETKAGLKIVNEIFVKIEALGYSPEDVQLLLSEVLEDLILNAHAPAKPKDKRDESF